ncbi:MAG: class I SAM-dependent rRNA methyltransferase [Bacteriovoracaceae bacterium]|nr:class I SAM-dependent rRNA methyltransferase [Bacteriovoracaceae bacterium]
MKEIKLSSKVYIRLLKGQSELYARDFEDSIKGVTPGEWVYLLGEKGHRFLGYLNPFSTNDIVGRILSECGERKVDNSEKYIIETLKGAITLRLRVNEFNNGCRLVHGQADGLTGVICDLYKNCALLQINTAGMDKHRELISKTISDLIGKSVFLLDNKKYRESEVLPEIEVDLNFPNNIEVSENGLSYELGASVIQKIGYYYDHRDNRKKLENYINRLAETPKKGIDLFSYVGSWGLHLLRAGIEKVDFVDQGDFESTVAHNLKINDFESSRGQFYRSDVFKFLDHAIENGEQYDVVVSDPPAFKKKDQNKGKALGGYTRLHGRALNVVTPGGLFVAASCTSNVSLEELDQTVKEASVASKRKVRLLDVGVQGADHPIRSLSDKGNYIKYILYYVE